MQTTQEFHSVGHMSALMQRSPREIGKAAELLGVKPAMKLNGVDHYDAEQLEQLLEHFREKELKS